MDRKINLLPEPRNCGNCRECCNGWLWGEVNGHYMYSGTPCFYTNETGCSIYEDRPRIPCKDFNCAWLLDKDIPEWFRPDITKIMLLADRNSGTGEDIIKENPKIKNKIVLISWLKTRYNKGELQRPHNLSHEEFLSEIDRVVENFGQYMIILNHYHIPIPNEQNIVFLKQQIDYSQDIFKKKISP